MGFYVMGKYQSVAWCSTRAEAEKIAKQGNYYGGINRIVVPDNNEEEEQMWPCTVTIEATMPDKRSRKITAEFDGNEGNGNIRENAIKSLRKRMRKPWLWYGVGFIIHKPFGTLEGVFEETK